MKTLKKTLCLVLAVVMVVGVLILPAYAADNYDAATATLQSYGVLQGYPDGGLHTDANITRGQMAAIIYRIMTGDTKSTDDEVATKYGHYANIYADASVAPWAKGYIGFCSNQGVLKGYPGGTVQANKQISGYEVQAMLLRALGYDKKDYTGDNWQYNVLADATKVGITKGMSRDPSLATPRGAVAQMAYNAACVATRVYYFGYVNDYVPSSEHLIEKVGDPSTTYDKWGIPSRTQNIEFTWPDYYQPAKAAVPMEPVAEYYHAVTQCDVADDLDMDDTLTFDVYVNGMVNATKIDIDPTNIVAQIGAQGRHTLIYDFDTTDDQVADTIIYIDTLLAEVTSVTAPTFDAAGHIKTPAKMNLTVYTGKAAPEAVTQEKTDGTTYAYAKGDMVLVNYVQNGLNGTTNVNVSGTDGSYGDTVKGTDAATKGANVKVLGTATAIDGKQTVINYNANKHTIDGTDYNDNNRLHLNQAGTNSGTFTWYFDNSPEGKNVIGSKLVKTESNFGVITRIWAEISGGTTSVKANVTYVDGRTATLDVGTIVTDRIDSNKHVTAGTGVTNNDELQWGPATYANASSKTPMTYDAGTKGSASTAFYVSNSYEENLAADKVIGSSDKTNHIIGANLFKIDAGVGGKYNFVEVIGNGKNDTYSDTDPSVDYKGLGNDETTMVPNKVANGDVIANDSTRYLIKTGGNGTDAKPFTFETKVGYTNIVEYVNGEVDYADVDGDGYADVVYITAAPKAATGDHIFFSEAVKKTDGSGSTWELRKSLDTSTGIYTIYGWLDGEYGAVQVKNGTGSLTDANDFANFVTNATGNQLWTITVTGGLVTDIDGKRTDHSAVNATVGSNLFGTGSNELDDGTNGMNTPGAAYTDMHLFVYTSTGNSAPGTESLDVTTLKLGTKYFNITALKDKPIVGDWADVVVEDTVVYLVYNDSNVVTQAYVVSKEDGSQYETGTTTGVDGEISTATTVMFNGTMVYTGKGWKDAANAIKNATSVSLADQLAGSTSTKLTVKNTRLSSGSASYDAYMTKELLDAADDAYSDSTGTALTHYIEGTDVAAGNEETATVVLAKGGYVVVRIDDGSNVDWIAFKIV